MQRQQHVLSTAWLSQFSSVQSLRRVQLFVTPWTAARQASLSIIDSRSLCKLMSSCPLSQWLGGIEPGAPLVSSGH